MSTSWATPDAVSRPAPSRNSRCSEITHSGKCRVQLSRKRCSKPSSGTNSRAACGHSRLTNRKQRIRKASVATGGTVSGLIGIMVYPARTLPQPDSANLSHPLGDVKRVRWLPSAHPQARRLGAEPPGRKCGRRCLPHCPRRCGIIPDSRPQLRAWPGTPDPNRRHRHRGRNYAVPALPLLPLGWHPADF